MNASAFLDTNILLYAFAEKDPRTGIAEDLLSAGARVGVQVLNEFAAVAMRKLGWPLEEISEALLAIRVLCPEPVPVTIETHDRALRIVKRYSYHIYDALIVAAALEASCTTLYSEDLRDGHVIEGLSIRNPFQTL